MLELVIPETEQWDELKQEFVSIKKTTIKLEHSLVSVSKWEAKWNVPFLSKENKTPEQTLDYIKCMTITQNVKDEVYLCLNRDHIQKINEYIELPMTATTFTERKGPKGNKNGEQITSELVYYWMVALQIPFECQKWHLNRLLTLIKVCNLKNQPDKKMTKRETMKSNAALNAARRKSLHSKG